MIFTINKNIFRMNVINTTKNILIMNLILNLNSNVNYWIWNKKICKALENSSQQTTFARLVHFLIWNSALGRNIQVPKLEKDNNCILALVALEAATWMVLAHETYVTVYGDKDRVSLKFDLILNTDSEILNENQDRSRTTHTVHWTWTENLWSFELTLRDRSTAERLLFFKSCTVGNKGFLPDSYYVRWQ